MQPKYPSIDGQIRKMWYVPIYIRSGRNELIVSSLLLNKVKRILFCTTRCSSYCSQRIHRPSTGDPSCLHFTSGFLMYYPLPSRTTCLSSLFMPTSTCRSIPLKLHSFSRYLNWKTSYTHRVHVCRLSPSPPKQGKNSKLEWGNLPPIHPYFKGPGSTPLQAHGPWWVLTNDMVQRVCDGVYFWASTSEQCSTYLTTATSIKFNQHHACYSSAQTWRNLYKAKSFRVKVSWTKK